MIDMQIASGKVVDGQIVIEGDLPKDQTSRSSRSTAKKSLKFGPELEAVLLESIAQGQRGKRFPRKTSCVKCATANELGVVRRRYRACGAADS